MGVVEIQAVCEGAVEEGSAGRPPAGAVAEHRGAAGAEAECPCGGQQRRAAVGFVATADHVAGEIEQQQPGAFDHRRGQGRGGQAGGEAG
jgi:hypothetical protein